MDRELELQLVGRLRTGDSEAFDAVYAAFNGRLYSFLARLSNSRVVAEDLTEETWLRLVVHAQRLQPDTRLGPWLFTGGAQSPCELPSLALPRGLARCRSAWSLAVRVALPDPAPGCRSQRGSGTNRIGARVASCAPS